MSKIKQVSSNLWVGPSMMGVTPHFKRTEHAIKYYPKGESLIHDPLQPGNKKPSLIYKNKETEDLGEVFEGASAGGHEGYLDMRVDSVVNRGEGFYIMGIIGILFWWSFEYFVLSAIQDELIRDISIYSGYAFFGIGALICLFRTLHTPVRFHKANQEVYVWHKKVLYRIPWDECELSIRVDNRNIGLKGQQDGYQLTLWLNPKHAINKDLTGQKHVPLNMFHNMDHHIPLYAYWEYVRRYMTGDTSLYIEMSKEPRVPGFNTEMAKRVGYIKAIFLFVIMTPFAFLFKPAKMALLSPFKEKWPAEVHEWTGERCDWH
ncbi:MULTISPECIES: hypothetical protein [Marinomonas]|uniref:Uncharacterized protein n=1 Tax=Marinomonas arctica TaxID=383750 RepID=A0A7H1J917_9GAMM|nr:MULTISPECIES: hypothetical protein [Marinomonas]MCS7487267.1 hypothetical protein [Marinomonas sp. BSi20414]QNT06983.1 hypothetical protein IBG28_04920 [Marinomonas arctica]GGN35500.1 hypothetical protein GCM10011350_32820 [Marinomonas arctica]